MKTILFITDLHTGSRVPELAGVREFAVSHDWHVEEIEVARLERPVGDVLRYWRPEGCILEGSSNLLPPVRAFTDIPAVHLDPGEALLGDASTFAVSNDNAAIADLALKELLKSDCAAYAFVGWSARVDWSRRQAARTTIPPPTISPAAAFIAAVGSAAETMVRLSAFVVFFTVVMALLASFLGTVPPLLAGFLELTVGITALTPHRLGFTLAAGLLGWGGVSVHCQAAAVLSDTDLSLRHYLLGKALQGLLSAAAAWWIYLLV